MSSTSAPARPGSTSRGLTRVDTRWTSTSPSRTTTTSLPSLASPRSSTAVWGRAMSNWNGSRMESSSPCTVMRPRTGISFSTGHKTLLQHRYYTVIIFKQQPVSDHHGRQEGGLWAVHLRGRVRGRVQDQPHHQAGDLPAPCVLPPPDMEQQTGGHHGGGDHYICGRCYHLVAR